MSAIEGDQELPQKVGFLTNSLSFVLYLSLPVCCAMVWLGFQHRDECPLNVSIPRYLFFAGLSGIVSVSIRILMVFVWRNLKRKNNIVTYDSTNHPSLAMVRPVMYLFLLFIVMWNFRATFYIFGMDPNFEDVSANNFCPSNVYWFTFALVIVFDVIFGLSLIIWLAAILAGLFFPKILSEVEDYDELAWSESPKVKRIPDEISETESEDTIHPIEDLNPDRQHLEEQKVSCINEVEQKKTPKKTEIISLKKFSDDESDSSSNDDPSESDVYNPSIVRFNSNVCMRRISTDEGRGSENVFVKFGQRMFEVDGRFELKRKNLVDLFEAGPPSPVNLEDSFDENFDDSYDEHKWRRNSEDLPGAIQLRDLFKQK